MTFKFNVNSKVQIKLTAAGRQHLVDLHYKMHQSLPIIPEYLPPGEVEGWSTWQLWELMGIFGELMRLPTFSPPFEPTIRILDADTPYDSTIESKLD